MSSKSNKNNRGRGDVNVAENQRWKEQIVKEVNNLRLNETFAINPMNLNVVSKKVTQQDVIGRAALSLEELQRQLDHVRDEVATVDQSATMKCSQNIRQQLKNSDCAPRDKYDEIQTTTMEYGWYGRELAEMNKQCGYDADKKWFYPKKKSDVTKMMN